MGNIKQLEERIAQLTELIKSGSEAIKSMKVALIAAEEERDRLADQRKENESRFEIAQDEKYYFVNFLLKGLGLTVQEDIYTNALGDRSRVDQNNCFKTKERAEEVLNKIKLLLKLERLHDIYCLDYEPDWNGNTERKWCIYYNHNTKKWICIDYPPYIEFLPQSSFPTKEIAQKVCDILNKELNP